MRRAGQTLTVLCVLALVAMLCGCGGSGGLARGIDTMGRPDKPPKPDPPLTNPALAFARVNTAGVATYCICLMNSDGQTIREITSPSGKAADHVPAWSPDGQMIAFLRQPDFTMIWCDLYTVRPDGAGLTLVRSFGSDDRSLLPDRKALEWLPDGSGFLYRSDEGHLVALSLSGEVLQLLDLDLDLRGGDLVTGRWVLRGMYCPSPDMDGALGYQGYIAYCATDRDNSASGNDVCLVQVTTGGDGSLQRADGATQGPTAVLVRDASQSNPVWSPDGQSIAFVDDLGVNRVMVVDVTTESGVQFGNPEEVFCNAWAARPTWSSDQQWLASTALVGKRNGGGGAADLMRIPISGAEATNLTDTSKAQEIEPDWNPMWTPDL